MPMKGTVDMSKNHESAGTDPLNRIRGRRGGDRRTWGSSLAVAAWFAWAAGGCASEAGPGDSGSGGASGSGGTAATATSGSTSGANATDSGSGTGSAGGTSGADAGSGPSCEWAPDVFECTPYGAGGCPEAAPPDSFGGCGPSQIWDEAGCMRRQCASDGDCDAGQVCYTTVDCFPQVCVPSWFACGKDGSGCACGSSGDCASSMDAVRWCIPAGDGPC